MQCPICNAAEMQHTPGKTRLEGLYTRPDTFTCPHCGAQAEQLPKEQFCFVVIPVPYAYPIGLSLGVPVSLEKARQMGEQARQWLELRTAVKGGIPVPDSPSVLKRGEACYLHIPNAVLSEERTKEGKTCLAETNRGDLYFTEKNMYVVGDKATRVPLEKIATITFPRGRLGFRFVRLDRKRPQHITVNSNLDHHLVQLLLHRQNNDIPEPQLGEAHTLRSSKYKLNLRALVPIWQKGGIARLALVAVVTLILCPCSFCTWAAFFGPEPTPTMALIIVSAT